MQREASRTLRSLSPVFQEDVGAEEYEVHVVENGSKQPVGEDFVRSFGANFHYHYLQDAPSSPAHALNFGVAKSNGENVAVMIDGAHILTPRVFTYARRITQTFDKAIVAVRRFYLGPGQQTETILEGYSQDVEDGLLAQIGWPEEPYRLFEIGAFMGKWGKIRPGWFGRFFESNCLIVPREIYDGIGGCDEEFDLPGGGFVNLDLLSQCLEYPGARLFVLLGEGSFHQVHGGTTTNTDPAEALQRVQSYREQYRRIRGREYEAPQVPMEFFGRLHPRSYLV